MEKLFKFRYQLHHFLVCANRKLFFTVSFELLLCSVDKLYQLSRSVFHDPVKLMCLPCLCVSCAFGKYGMKVRRYNWHSAGSLSWPFPVLNVYFSNKTYGSNFIKQHSETVMVWNYQNADWSLRKNIVSFIIILAHFQSLFQVWESSFIEKLHSLAWYGTLALIVTLK